MSQCIKPGKKVVVQSQEDKEFPPFDIMNVRPNAELSLHQILTTFRAEYEKEVQFKIKEVKMKCNVVMEDKLLSRQSTAVSYVLSLLEVKQHDDYKKAKDKSHFRNIFLAYLEDVNRSNINAVRDLFTNFKLPLVKFPKDVTATISKEHCRNIDILDEARQRRSPRVKSSTVSDTTDREYKSSSNQAKVVSSKKEAESATPTQAKGSSSGALSQALRQAELELFAAGSTTAEPNPLPLSRQQRAAVKLEIGRLQGILEALLHAQSYANKVVSPKKETESATPTQAQGSSSGALSQALRQAELELFAAGSTTAEPNPLPLSRQQRAAVKLEIGRLQGILEARLHAQSYANKVVSPKKETESATPTQAKGSSSGALSQALRQAELELFAAVSTTAEPNPLPLSRQQRAAVKLEIGRLQGILEARLHAQSYVPISAGMQEKVVEMNATVLESEGKEQPTSLVEWKKELPITSLDGLKALNGQLQHKKQMQDMALYLSKRAPNTNIGGAVAHVASLLFDHGFSLQLNIRGSYQNAVVQKIKLMEYPNIMKLMQVSVGFLDVGEETTEKSVNSALAKWLRNACNRQGGRSKR